MKQITEWNYSDCNDTVSANRTNQLFEQLKALRNAFMKHDIAHTLAFGSLVGAIRDHMINVYEVDNDVMLIDPAPFPVAFYQTLFNAGYIIFKNDIWRVCQHSSQRRRANDAPWDHKKQYFPYTDVYPISEFGKRLCTIKSMRIRACNNSLEWTDRNVKPVNFGDTFMYVPSNDEFMYTWLGYRYENWRKAPSSKSKKYGQGKIKSKI